MFVLQLKHIAIRIDWIQRQALSLIIDQQKYITEPMRS